MVKKSGALHYTRENQRGVIRTKVAELTADYNAAKAIVESYGIDYSSIRDFLGDKLNLNYFYQQMGNKLNSTAE